MNKQQLIEKAVLQLNGEWPKLIAPWENFVHYKTEVLMGIEWLFSAPDGCHICSREEFNAAADRVRGKPDWPSHPVTLFKITDQRYEPADEATESERLGITPPVNKNECCNISLPAKPWFEAGELPKAGTKCLCYFDDGRECWHECVVIGSTESEVANGYLAVSLIGKHERKLVWVNDFKPIKTDKEKAIDFALGKIHNGMNRHAAPYIIGQLYDAGLLRLPDQK